MNKPLRMSDGALPPPPAALCFYDVGTDTYRDLRTGKKVEDARNWVQFEGWFPALVTTIKGLFAATIFDPTTHAALFVIRALRSESVMQPVERVMGEQNPQPGHIVEPTQDATAGMTKGRWRVGVTFNPSGNALVSQLKEKAARFMDEVELIPKADGPGSDELNAEIGRLKALAITYAETAAMFAVKAATKEARR